MDGVDALIIISLFRKGRGLARKYAKPGTPGACILFMDELDSIGSPAAAYRWTSSGRDGRHGHVKRLRLA